MKTDKFAELLDNRAIKIAKNKFDKNFNKCKKICNFVDKNMEMLMIIIASINAIPIIISLLIISFNFKQLNLIIILVLIALAALISFILFYFFMLFTFVIIRLNELIDNFEEEKEVSERLEQKGLSLEDKENIKKLLNVLFINYEANFEFESIEELFNKKLYKFHMKDSKDDVYILIDKEGNSIEVG